MCSPSAWSARRSFVPITPWRASVAAGRSSRRRLRLVTIAVLASTISSFQEAAALAAGPPSDAGNPFDKLSALETKNPNLTRRWTSRRCSCRRSQPCTSTGKSAVRRCRPDGGPLPRLATSRRSGRLCTIRPAGGRPGHDCGSPPPATEGSGGFMADWTTIDTTGDGQTDCVIDFDRVERVYRQEEDAVFVFGSGRELVSKNPTWTEVLAFLATADTVGRIARQAGRGHWRVRPGPLHQAGPVVVKRRKLKCSPGSPKRSRHGPPRRSGSPR